MVGLARRPTMASALCTSAFAICHGRWVGVFAFLGLTSRVFMRLGQRLEMRITKYFYITVRMVIAHSRAKTISHTWEKIFPSEGARISQ